jgi:RNA polymerase sigma factor (sigma-70 family)
MSGDGGQHLSQISTLWMIVSQARGRPRDPSVLADDARKQLLERYGGAVRRYLLGALHNPHDAEELAQEFALRFLRGELNRADPDRGRFRDYVKGVLFHLVADHHRRQRRAGLQPLPAGALELQALADKQAHPDRAFADAWREQLLHDAWAALADFQRESGKPFYDVLRLRADNPALRSPEMARRLGAQFDKPVTADWVRQTLHRARDRFADFLIQRVAQTLKDPRQETIEDELIDLGLLNYCRTALKRYPLP